MSKLWGMDDLEAAWIDLHEANAKLRWFVGNPSYERRPQVGWSLSAFNPRERPAAGRRTDEWTAVGPTEAACVGAMARHLRQIGERTSQTAPKPISTSKWRSIEKTPTVRDELPINQGHA